MDGDPVSETLVGRLARLPGLSQELIDLGQLMVACADLEPSAARVVEIDELCAGRGGTPENLSQPVERLGARIIEDAGWTGDWLTASLALLAVTHPWFAFEELSGGALHRRIDAIYDMFETDYCAHEVQSLYLQIVEGLVLAAESGSSKAVKAVASFGLSAAGGLATVHGAVNAMALATRASEWLESANRRPRSETFALADVLLVWQLIPTGEDGQWTEDERRLVDGSQEQCRVARSRADLGLARMWESVLAAMGAGVHRGVEMPSLSGRRLDAAREEAQALGLEVYTLDAWTGASVDRTPFVEANWSVAGQFPARGSEIAAPHVVLGVVKLGEPTKSRLVERLEELHRSIS